MAEPTPSVAKKRKVGKQKRMLEALTWWLELERENFENYVRIHRLIYDCDPDLDDVPNQFGDKED